MGDSPLTRGVTGRNDLCLCAFFFPEIVRLRNNKNTHTKNYKEPSKILFDNGQSPTLWARRKGVKFPMQKAHHRNKAFLLVFLSSVCFSVQGMVCRENLHGNRYMAQKRSTQSTPIVFALFYLLSLVFDRFWIFSRVFALLGCLLSGTGGSQRDSRESIRANRFAIETPMFIACQADSHESLEFPIRANHPIRANRANRFARITPLRLSVSDLFLAVRFRNCSHHSPAAILWLPFRLP